LFPYSDALPISGRAMRAWGVIAVSGSLAAFMSVTGLAGLGAISHVTTTPGAHAEARLRSQGVTTDKDRAAKVQLILGRTYESEGRLTDAEAAYAKAVETGSPALLDHALASLRRVVGRRETSLAKSF